MTKWFLYIVICEDSCLYTGITTSVQRRLIEHNSKRGAKAVFGKLPVQLIYQEEYVNQKDAARREREIKSWTHDEKIKFVEKQNSSG
jgi:putative endonuclease